MSRVRFHWVLWSLGCVLVADAAAARKCKPDAVEVGPACVDRVEASVWETTDAKAIKRIRLGKVRGLADLAGAVQRGVASDDYGAGCPDTGSGCTADYAVSLVGVKPSAFVTWFQAAAACRNAGKRLATNLEWQMAALGTPDPGTDDGTDDCNVNSLGAPAVAGSRSGCVSDVGAFDMVGNLWEWIADWEDGPALCASWAAAYGSDLSCFGGSGATGLPSAIARGGFHNSGTFAGVFALSGVSSPSSSFATFGFRCARER